MAAPHADHGPPARSALASGANYPLYSAIDPFSGTLTSNAFGVFQEQGGVYALVSASQLTADPATPPTVSSAGFYIDPERGRIVARQPGPVGALRVTYHYGFPSTIGAGPYDRRVQGYTPASSPSPVIGGGSNLVSGLDSLAPSGTVTIGDFLTYTSIADVGSVGAGIVAVTIGAENTKRPLIRLPAPRFSGVTEWVFTGGDSANPGQLVLDGLFISGGDLVLRGTFDCVTLLCCTLDPGSVADVPAEPGGSPPSSPFAIAADGRELVPCRLWIEGTVRSLTLDRCITGPIRTRGSGQVETLTITNSIIQAIPTGEPNAASVPYSASIPTELTHAALAFTNGDVILSRCTVLGPVVVHHLQASECILRDLVDVDDTQDGCVRFSAYAEGSTLPRQYESVPIAPGAELFTSTDFGQPGYCQLLPTVDAAIATSAGANPPAPPTIAAGGENETEMGAYARDLNPVRASGLLIKFQEYMPAGLVPVLIYVT